jgi:uncharacterized protein
MLKEYAPMRRKEKEIIDRTEIDQIIQACTVCHLGLSKDNLPYVVPLSFGYDGRCIYFHCAREGRKLEFLAANAQVCFQMECGISLSTHTTQACRWSFAFRSIIGTGLAEELVAPSQKHQALLQIVQHYGQGHVPPDLMDTVRVFRIVIEQVTGKCSNP